VFINRRGSLIATIVRKHLQPEPAAYDENRTSSQPNLPHENAGEYEGKVKVENTRKVAESSDDGASHRPSSNYKGTVCFLYLLVSLLLAMIIYLRAEIKNNIVQETFDRRRELNCASNLRSLHAKSQIKNTVQVKERFHSISTAGENSEKVAGDIESGYRSDSVRTENVPSTAFEARGKDPSRRRNDADDERGAEVSVSLESNNNDSSEPRHADTDSETAEETVVTLYVHSSQESRAVSSTMNEETNPQVEDIVPHTTWTTAAVKCHALFADIRKMCRMPHAKIIL